MHRKPEIPEFGEALDDVVVISVDKRDKSDSGVHEELPEDDEAELREDTGVSRTRVVVQEVRNIGC